jgi:membrane fusion protein, heavy metal efflux system
MTYLFKILLLTTLLVSPFYLPLYAQDVHLDHDEDLHDEEENEEEESLLSLAEASMRMAGIRVEELHLQKLSNFIVAPGEVQLDQYRSAEVTSPVDALVVKRNVTLGEEVEVGQSLLTLASVEVASAQGELSIAATEWRRLMALGEAAVGAQRYIQAEVAYEQARLKLMTYGLDSGQIEQIANRDRTLPLGNFDLVAPVQGTVLSDDFRVGQWVALGESLFVIADESLIWVEVSLSPGQAGSVQVDMPAHVEIDGHWHEGVVIQKHHMLNEQTRTVPVRIALELAEEHHHAGEFVQVSIAVESEDGVSAMVVPESALAIGGDGDWTVFVEEEPGSFLQIEVERGQAWGNLVPIYGIEEGTRVVVDGAFFLAAELAKSGFDIHNH